MGFCSGHKNEVVVIKSCHNNSAEEGLCTKRASSSICSNDDYILFLG